MKNFKMFIPVLLAGTLLAGCSAQTDSDDTVRKVVDVKENETAAISDGVEARVLKYEVVHGKEDWDKNPTDDSKEFLQITVQLKNTGELTADYNEWQWSLFDKDGQAMDYGYIENRENPLDGGQIDPDKTVEGNLLFIVPKDVNSFDLLFQDWSGNQDTSFDSQRKE